MPPRLFGMAVLAAVGAAVAMALGGPDGIALATVWGAAIGVWGAFAS